MPAFLHLWFWITLAANAAGGSLLGIWSERLIAKERVPVREPAVLENMDGQHVGHVTSGLLSPTLNQPIALAYVQPEYAQPGTEVFAMVRGKPVAMVVSATPFLPPRYHRG